MRATRLHCLFLLLLFAPPTSAVTSAEPSAPSQNKRVLLLGQSPDGHPRSTHEYMPGMRVLASCLRNVKQVEAVVVKADDPWEEGPRLLQEADGVVLFVSEGARWIQADQRRMQALVKLTERGGGLVVLHWGMGTRDAKNIASFLNLFGGCHGGPDRKYRVVEKAKVAVNGHPVTRGIESFSIREEFYYRLKFIKSRSGLTPLLQTRIEGNVETVCWAWQRPGGGRSFGYSGGHFHENWKRPEMRRLMTQAVLWSVGLPIAEKGVDVSVPQASFELAPE